MRRGTIVAAVAGIAGLVGAMPSPAQAAAPTCAANTVAPLSFKVDRNSTGRDKKRRSVSLSNAGGSASSAIFPVQVTVVRGGKTRTLTFSSLNSEYRYRAKKGESAGFMAVYPEDTSGYGRSSVAGPSVFIPVDIGGVVTTLTFALQQVFGLLPVQLQVIAPAKSAPGAYAANTCTRVQPLAVQEATTARRARNIRR